MIILIFLFIILILLFSTVGLCDDCSHKLNYHQKRREVTKQKKKRSKNKTKKHKSDQMKHEKDKESSDEGGDTEPKAENQSQEPSGSANIWRENQQTVEEKSRDEEFEEYLEDLFL